MSLRRLFVTVDGRRNHLRVAGSGVPVVILHQSPQSSAAVLPMLRLLAETHCVIAPDTPGFGLSDLLPDGKPSIGDFADNVKQVLDKLGIHRCLVMGTHTGAEIALELAVRYPQLVAHLVTDGLPLFSAHERKNILAQYFEPLPLYWDGSHLARLWARVRQQALFFPWYDARPESRLDYDLPGPDYVHGWVLDYLYAGPDYYRGYSAAFRWLGEEAVARLKVPAHLLYRRREPLAAHRNRLPELPPRVSVETTPHDPAALRKRAAEIFGQCNPAGLRRCEADSLPAGDGDRFVAMDFGLLRLRCSGAAKAPAVLLLHDAGRSGSALLELAESLKPDFRVLLPDLPGQGESDGADILAPTAVARVLGQLLDQYAPAKVSVIAEGAAVAVADALLQAEPDRVRALQLHDPMAPDEALRPVLSERLHPALDPDPVGGHLLRRWQIFRDSRLFWPWFEPLRSNRLDQPLPEPQDLQRQLFDSLRCSEFAAIWRTWLAADAGKALRAASGRVTAQPGCPHLDGVEGEVVFAADRAEAWRQHRQWLGS